MLPSMSNVLFCPSCRNPVLESQDCSICGLWSYENILALLQNQRTRRTRARYPNSYYENNQEKFAAYADARRKTKWHCEDCNKTIQLASRGRHLVSPYHKDRIKVNTSPTAPPANQEAAPPIRLRTSVAPSNGVSTPVVRRKPLIVRRRTSA